MRAVRKVLGARSVLDGLDLDVESRTLHAIIGVNGAGKSTLLRVLATTLLPDGGEVHVGGIDVVRQSTLARSEVGLCLADERSWTFPLTGRQNLEFFAALHGLPRRAAQTRCSEVIDEVGLAEPADRPFNEYSTGMRLRLSVARALIHRPSVLLLDEPSRSLLLVTHDLAEARQADAVSLVAGGKVARQWQPVPDADTLSSAVEESAALCAS
jgi:ABC-2 type transport system ATP-binding protein